MKCVENVSHGCGTDDNKIWVYGLMPDNVRA